MSFMSEIVSPIALWKAVFCSYCIGVFAGCSGTEEQTSIDAPEIISSSQLIKDTGGRTTYIASNTYYTGTVIDYYGDGKSIRYRATYEDGLRTGEEAEFRKDGQPTRKCQFSGGKRHGLELFWHQNGHPKSATNYFNNLASGACHSWNTNGIKVRTSTYTNGMLLSHCAFHPNGKRKRVARYLKGKLHGVSQQWYPNGEIEWRAAYVNGLQNGMAIGWLSDGQKSYESDWHLGTSHGLSKKWYANGNLKSMTTYLSGKKNGEAMGAYEDGQLEWQAYWHEDQIHGVYREWHPNGRRKLERIYLNGEKYSEYNWPAIGELPTMKKFGYGLELDWSIGDFLKLRGLDCSKIHYSLGAPELVRGQEMVFKNLTVKDAKNRIIWREATLQVINNRVVAIRFSGQSKGN